MATERERSVTGFAYHPALDGVRAVAVLAVLLFHGGVGFLPGGFLGVDAFFVLSGFLITSLLLAEYFGARACRAPIGSRGIRPIRSVLIASTIREAGRTGCGARHRDLHHGPFPRLNQSMRLSA